jgi:hypothetical protein
MCGALLLLSEEDTASMTGHMLIACELHQYNRQRPATELRSNHGNARDLFIS